MLQKMFDFFNGLGGSWAFSSITEMVIAFTLFVFGVTLATVGFIMIYNDSRGLW